MIRLLKRKEIDEDSYNQCVLNSHQNRMYALSWYLDIVADDWAALILNDYEAVMPIPYMRALKYLNQKKIIQPFLCQQLGIFSKKDSIDIEVNFFKTFLELSPKYYAFNSFNDINLLEKKVNQELMLNKSYEEIRSKYRKDRKYRVNQSQKRGLQIESVQDGNKLIEIAKGFYDIKQYNSKFFETLINLISEVVERKKGHVLNITKDSEVIGAAFFLKQDKRIVYLFSAFSAEGKELQAPSFLLDSIIQQYSNSEFILDFEGSSIPEIASFFRSFGAKETLYPIYNSK